MSSSMDQNRIDILGSDYRIRSDILGLGHDTVRYSKNNDVENQPDTLLERNWTTNGMEEGTAQITDDKKPLVQNLQIQKSPLLAMPKTKMEFFKLFGILVAAIIFIVILHFIVTNRNDGKYPETRNKM